MAAWNDRIKALLADLRVSQSQLAGFVGVDQATVSRWLSGSSDPPSFLTHQVISALEAIVASGQIEAFFQAIRRDKIQPRTRQMLEAIFTFSSRRGSHAKA